MPLIFQEIPTLTLDHYNRNAGYFWQGTRDRDTTQNIAALIEAIEAEPPFAILNFGCGPGRDLKAFAALGHAAIVLDGKAEFVEVFQH